MLKDRGHKGSWKGVAANNQRMKKKSYGNIHSINDRGISEIYETLGASAGPGGGGGTSPQPGGPGGLVVGGPGSAPSSPWSSPIMGRKSVVTSAPTQFGERAAQAGGKLLPMSP